MEEVAAAADLPEVWREGSWEAAVRVAAAKAAAATVVVMAMAVVRAVALALAERRVEHA